MKTKSPQQSFTVSTKIVLPNDTNTLGNLMGGQLLNWMDVNAAIAAHRHCGRVVVTASVNHVAFKKPIKLGAFVTIESKVSRAFSSSMEVYSDVFIEDSLGNREKSNDAIYTFVAVDQNGNPIDVPQIKPETELEISRFDGALRRRELSLILAGKLLPENAPNLKSIFEFQK